MRYQILAAILAAPAVALAQVASVAPPPAPLPKAADFVTKAAQSDQFEIVTGRLAATKATNADLRSFGAMMVKDHTDSSASLRAAAKIPASTPPQPLDPDQQAMLKELEAQTGKAFDTTYVTQQLTAHQQALALHTAYATSGDNAQLRAVAGKVVPVVKMHLDMLEKTRAADQNLPPEPRP